MTHDAAADNWHSVYLALGGNLGDRAANLASARRALPPAVEILAASPVYETPPWGVTEQPAFLNQALHARTHLAPLDLLAHLKRIERDLGRTPTIRYGPRPIDLDILFYDDLQIDTPALTIPHPRLHERAFVLTPLADLAPALRHPVLGRSVADLLYGLEQSGITCFDTPGCDE